MNQQLYTILDQIIDKLDVEYNIANPLEFSELYVATLTIYIRELYTKVYEAQLGYTASMAFARIIFEAINKAILILCDKEYAKFVVQEFANDEKSSVEYQLGHIRSPNKQDQIYWAKSLKNFLLETKKINPDKYQMEQIIHRVDKLIEYKGWKNYYVFIYRDFSGRAVHYGFQFFKDHTYQIEKGFRLKRNMNNNVNTIHKMLNGLMGLYCTFLNERLSLDLETELNELKLYLK